PIMTISSTSTSTHATRRTKIVATVGPASRDKDHIKALIEAGVNVFRLNFSHGTYDEHEAVLHTIRETAKELSTPTAILQDLSGPKIRITNVKGDYLSIHDEDEVFLKLSHGEVTDQSTIYVGGLDPAKVLQPGHQVLLADGILVLQAIAIEGDAVRCTITKGGRIRSRVGIAFPDSDIGLPATTEKDLQDLSWGVKHAVDYVAISFVNNAQDVLQLREAIDQQGGHAHIIAKIERKSALQNIYEILDVSDGLMVARGDLGLELPLAQVPRVQKRLIEEANFRGIPVIVATQMLHSMITAVRPTRAEVSDIATAVMSGADAVMLSEETAIGEHPTLAVEHLSRIAYEAEGEFDFANYRPRLRNADTQTIPDAVAYAACAAAVKVEASAVIACTETGTSARLIAKYRPQQPLFGVSSSITTLRRMSLYWGVIPLLFEAPETHENELETALRKVQQLYNFDNGSRAVITGGLSVRTPGSTSVMEIREMSYL
ncbi:MAG: pyruvate kinase, partial [Bdellovibrionales bacterium]|nr:pyruvate kinase [Bdellovibrionales bacterium]